MYIIYTCIATCLLFIFIPFSFTEVRLQTVKNVFKIRFLPNNTVLTVLTVFHLSALAGALALTGRWPDRCKAAHHLLPSLACHPVTHPPLPECSYQTASGWTLPSNHGLSMPATTDHLWGKYSQREVSRTNDSPETDLADLMIAMINILFVTY